MKYFLIPALAGCFLFTGCIKDAPPNPEADIIAFKVDSSKTTSPVVIDQANRKIFLYLKPDAYDQGVVPTLELSPGATVTPASGEAIDFDATVRYTVTSASGENQKIYEIDVVEIGNWSFDFETWTQHPDDKYEYPLDDNIQLWSSGNPGIALAGVEKRPDAYPTRSTPNGYQGSMAAEMLTIPGTPLSMILGIRLFPGSFFLGDFNSNVALSDPLAATEFGQPYFEMPDKFVGYYKYTPGANFQDAAGTVIPSETDKFSLYAVLYNGPTRLNGTNVNTSDSVVARAVLPNSGPAVTQFTRFEIPFTYLPGRVAGNNLMMAIVASSSYQGDLYKGAIGSRLTVDSLKIVAR